jgi:hypothetical protein
MQNASTDGLTVPYALSKIAIPVQNGEEHTFSCQAHQVKTSGTNGAHAFVREYDVYGTQVAPTNSNILSTTGTTAWTQIKASFTPNRATRSMKVGLALGQIVGTAWFDHLHFGPTRWGIYG